MRVVALLPVRYGGRVNWKNALWAVRFVVPLILVPGLHAHEPVTRARTAVQLPNLPGYLTLKCDFHIHTVFSDGLVWPTVRSEEAWREGLDAIAITDHLEYLPHKGDVSTNHNRAHDLAAQLGRDLDVLVIHGSEVTRDMPPGHHNAIFLTNSMPLAVTNWWDAFRAARAQGAFIFWNHPGWGPQLTDGKPKWFPEHTQLVDQDLMHGIEVVNGRDYYPEAHRWAIEQKLTLFSNSDIHAPLNLDYHVHDGDHRPLTLVFARERTLAAIKEALFDRRTAVYSGNRLIGEERFLRPLYALSVTVLNPAITLKGRERAFVQIRNDSDVAFELEQGQELAEVTAPRDLTLAARKTVLLELKARANVAAGSRPLALKYRVRNLITAPDELLPVTIEVKVTLAPAVRN